mgnify:CR=1 FL=1
MTAILAWLLANPTVLAVIGGIAAALGIGFHQRRAGARNARDRQAAGRLDTLTEAQRIDEVIAGRDPDANRKELGKWSR